MWVFFTVVYLRCLKVIHLEFVCACTYIDIPNVFTLNFLSTSLLLPCSLFQTSLKLETNIQVLVEQVNLYFFGTVQIFLS